MSSWSLESLRVKPRRDLAEFLAEDLPEEARSNFERISGSLFNVQASMYIGLPAFQNLPDEEKRALLLKTRRNTNTAAAAMIESGRAPAVIERMMRERQEPFRPEFSR